jgi:2-oxo-4-hydroxy-4-carboxy-5-ureidoimidazoline decarboxylase
MEAFSHHTKIGDLKSLQEKFSATKEWASGEQQSVSAATDQVLIELKELNEAYENKFGYIFIICATGKSAEEMLSALKQRILNDGEDELKIAAEEQRKIMHLRINKLFA